MDILLEITGMIVILGCFVFIASNYQDLPDSLPRHYGLDGVPDAYSAKGIIWVLPIVGLILYMVIGLVSNVPSMINIPFKPNPEKVEFYQKKYCRMIRVLNVVMVCIFAFLTYQSIQIGIGAKSQLPQYFSLVAITLLLGIPLIFVIPDLIKARKQN
ncbi:Protein of unknown function [Algoriphagus boritolerans DSM 17298 = JCM 18970]|uniref:DUF1648 domain-containing protein n=1 Tax=Algoriphagus boritolerans DSM 17298 = JCM 18970 TaxID=1120964 RepID=A0A1H5YS41_9BACT|nr:Protein of unknown function [Algoriphagus boritolerans DSM 17298 = JCM 18970]